MQTKDLKVVVVDDDSSQLDLTLSLLKKIRPELAVAAEASPLDAMQIKRHGAALWIADIEFSSPARFGSFLSQAKHLYGIFFIGHSDEGGLRCEPIDFLTKPLERKRLEEIFQRIEKTAGFQTTEFPQQAPNQGVPSLIRFVKGRDIVTTPLDDVLYFQAQQKYTRVVLKNQDGLLRMTLSEVMQNLDRHKFWRAHRSYIVNIGQVTTCRRDDLGRIELHLQQREEKLIVSRPYEHLFSKDGFA